MSVRKIAYSCDVSSATAHRILTEELKMTKVCARWIPRLLTDQQMQNRVRLSKKFLQGHQRGGDNFLRRIITTDETWFHYFDLESKQQSMVWKSTDSPPPKKAKVAKSVGKNMFIVFMDFNGVILTHAVPAGTTVNSAYYSKVVRRDLMRALRKERPAMADDIENVLLHQDNAPCHTSQHTQMELDILGLPRLEHAPYSPDLAPLDFALFPTVKEQLRGTHFKDTSELTTAVLNIIASLDSHWFNDVFHAWVSRHKKCVLANGRYFEKE